MADLGKWLMIFGAGSFALNHFGMEFSLLMWIDLWGVETGNLIRMAFIGLGAVIMFAGMRSANQAGEHEDFSDIETLDQTQPSQA